MLDNLAFACFEWNRLKGLTSLRGPETGVVVPLFHRRRDRWDEHFRFDGVRLVPLSPVGRPPLIC